MRSPSLVPVVAVALLTSSCAEQEGSRPLPIQAGQRYRTLENLEVIAMTHWNTAFTGGHQVVFPAGEVFTVACDPPQGATAASCDPERYEALHEAFIPAEDREHPKYSNYSLSINLADISGKTERLSE